MENQFNVGFTANQIRTKDRSFIEACGNGETKRSRKLLDSGANVNAVDEIPPVGQVTALSMACSGGHYGIAKMLLNNKADANFQAENGMTPLMIVCLIGDPEMVKLLIRYGADENMRNINGHSAIDLFEPLGCYNIIGDINEGHKKETEQALISSIEERNKREKQDDPGKFARRILQRKNVFHFSFP